MDFDQHENFSYSTVATVPSPAASGSTLYVAAGDGAKFDPVPRNVSIWPVGVQPTVANAEVARVVDRSGDKLTVLRAQEGSAARTVVVGDQIATTVTAKALTDIEDRFAPSLPLAERAPLVSQVIPAGTSSFVASDYEIATHVFAGATVQDSNFGIAAPDTYLAQSFLATDFFVLSAIELYLARAATQPVDQFVVEIRADNGGIPATTTLDSVTLSLSLALTFDWFRFPLAANIGPGIPYWIVVRRTDFAAPPGANYKWGYDSAAGYTDGVAKTSANSGVTWGSAETFDYCFRAISDVVLELEADAVLEIG